MPDPSSSSEDGSSLWKSVRNLLLGRSEAPTLRESLEEAIEEHEQGDGGVAPADDPDDLSKVERTMLRNLLHFNERTVGDVAVPRGDIIAFDEAASFPDLVKLFREAGHSRLPVFRGNLDDVIGMVHVKDVYVRIAETFDDAVSSKPFLDLRVDEFLRSVLFVPPSMHVVELLARMRAERTHMAIVVDEYGGTDGLLTIEDLVEEIVGEIEDEHDEEEERLLVPLGDALWEADARVELVELEDALGSRFDEDEGDDVDTLGGLVFLLAGRVPVVGETIEHPNGWRFEVTAGDARKVSRLRLHPPAQVAADAERED